MTAKPNKSYLKKKKQKKRMLYAKLIGRITFSHVKI